MHVPGRKELGASEGCCTAFIEKRKVKVDANLRFIGISENILREIRFPIITEMIGRSLLCVHTTLMMCS
jgi:hypothetical protein